MQFTWRRIFAPRLSPKADVHSLGRVSAEACTGWPAYTAVKEILACQPELTTMRVKVSPSQAQWALADEGCAAEGSAAQR